MILVKLQTLFCLIPISSVICVASKYMVTEYEWKYLTYAWQTQDHVDAYMLSGRYNYKNIIPVDVDRSPDGRVFVTAPRMVGVPASVHIISNQTNYSGRLLLPYPSWRYHEREVPCTGIVSVHRIAIDECNRLWVLDSGVIDYERICPATLFVFDLYSDMLQKRIEISDEFAQNADKWGFLVNLIVETSGPKCQETTIFMADTAGSGLVVYNLESGDICRLESEAFKANPKNSVITIEDESFQQLYGVYGMALSPKYPDGSRLLSIKPLASRSIYSIKIVPGWLKNIDENTEQIENLRDMHSQATVMAYASNGILFYGLTKETAIGCWNPFRNISDRTSRILMTDPDRLQFISGMKFIKGNDELSDHLLLMTNRQQKSIAGTMDFEEPNFRILRISIEDLTRGTICAR